MKNLPTYPQSKPVTVDNYTCQAHWDSESVFITCDGECVFILYGDEPTLRSMWFKLFGNKLSSDYLERMGFQSV